MLSPLEYFRGTRREIRKSGWHRPDPDNHTEKRLGWRSYRYHIVKEAPTSTKQTRQGGKTKT